jgi:hypothetical protein
MNPEQPQPNQNGDFVDTEGRPIGEMAAKYQAENKRADDYLNNENPDASITRQYPSKEAAQASMEENTGVSREHAEKNLGAYAAQAQAEMEEDFKLRETGYHGNIEPGTNPRASKNDSGEGNQQR